MLINKEKLLDLLLYHEYILTITKKNTFFSHKKMNIEYNKIKIIKHFNLLLIWKNHIKLLRMNGLILIKILLIPSLVYSINENLSSRSWETICSILSCQSVLDRCLNCIGLNQCINCVQSENNICLRCVDSIINQLYHKWITNNTM